MDTQHSTPQPHWIAYKAGGKNSIGEDIDFIYTQGEAFTVYTIGPKKDLRWEINPRLCPNHIRATNLYKSLHTRARSILPKRKEKIVDALLISDLIDALLNHDVLPDDKLFCEAILYINTTQNDLTHFRYVATALICTGFFAIPSVAYLYSFGKNPIYQILVGASLGSCGAFVSVLQRFQNVNIPKYSSWRFTILRALSRILIGVIFGGLFVVFNKSGAILNMVNTNTFLLYSFAFISGLSERYFPDLVRNINDQTNKEE